MPGQGSFIVIEGIDGSGGETQTRKAREFIKSKGRDILELTYPNPKSPIGKVIYEYLDKKFDLSVEVQTALYIADFALDKKRIADALTSGGVVLSNRYFFSTLAYQCGAKGFPKEKALEMARILDIPVPDLVVYVDISAQTSMKRKAGEKAKARQKLDRHEEDKALLERVRDSYLQTKKEGLFAKRWETVDGEAGIEKVALEIRNVLEKELRQ